MLKENGFVRKTYYSEVLKHLICREHIDHGVSLADLVRKYKLSCHSLIHDWLRKLGYVAGVDRRTRSAYIGIENLTDLKNKSSKKGETTAEQQEIEFLKKQLEEAKLQAEGYRRMIETAEEELKIPIRKKSSTK